MNTLDAVNRHKTKVLGAITVVLGFVQGYPGLSGMISESAYAWLMFCIGIGVTVCGFLNSYQEDR